jgi:DNA helicase-2/ATP-dependent DNA helicase PcrA
MVMSMHKSKGKEFDGVVIVEGVYAGLFFDPGRERPPFERSRRLLRVAITRARINVAIVRQQDVHPLTGQ